MGLVFLALFAIQLRSESGQPKPRKLLEYPRFEKISLEEGLSQGSVYCILQDSEGFLWVGTEGGLDKYDGYRFTN